ncbi:AMP-binding enzyme [Gordonia humi]|uniref:Non-ribosomal peptide synthetase component E (Peptide arylation enzyme) n=2 Tax=Gordonia humi TaxID=686429 RepID=A0A840EQM5_9ACTN|nr:non-ribosomal peptide synthetase component E (peptide arylation enzyme) [Gordonia humi]
MGRIKDVVIRKGENIAPLEIEELLSAHPAIAEVAMISVPDDERGEMVCAVVVPESVVEAPDLAAVVDFLTRAHLMKQKLPERLEVVESLPRTGLAKIARNELRTRFGRPDAHWARPLEVSASTQASANVMRMSDANASSGMLHGPE